MSGISIPGLSNVNLSNPADLLRYRDQIDAAGGAGFTDLLIGQLQNPNAIGGSNALLNRIQNMDPARAADSVQTGRAAQDGRSATARAMAGEQAGPAGTAPPAHAYTVIPVIRGQQSPTHAFIDGSSKVTVNGREVSAQSIINTLNDPNKSPQEKEQLRAASGLVRADNAAGSQQWAAPTSKLQSATQTRIASLRSRAAAGQPTTLAQAGAGPAAAAADGAAAPRASYATRNAGPSDAAITAGATAGVLGLNATGGVLEAVTGVPGIGTAAGIAGFGTAASVAQLAGLDGIAFGMRRAMRSVAASYSDKQFIGMLHSGLNIETLLYYFMAYASDKYDKKLREKMEEWTLAEQMQDKMERNKNLGNMAAGVLSLIPGVGSAVGTIVNAAVDTANRAQSALNGNMKSSTVLMQEVQILIQQWKVVTDLTSNLSKDLHDMAMTAVRNLR